jgi:Zn-dependent protease with chaperone function
MKKSSTPVAIPSVKAREESHRRMSMIAIAILLILSIAPVMGHHLWSSVGIPLTGIDHLGAFCVVALRSVFAPVHGLFHLTLGVGLAYALWDRGKAWRHQVQTLSLLEISLPQPRDAFFLLAAEAGLDPARLRIVEGLPNPAFTVGLASPRVFVARALLLKLPEPELVAVLAHESAHVERRDPLRVAAFRFIACTLFWIPALRRLSDDMADEVEILADDAAARGQPLVLASAILRLANWRQQSIAGAVGFERCDLLDRRIRRLAGEDTSVGSHLTRRSVAGAALVLILVASSGAFAAPSGATPRTLQSAHCLHRGESALRHLFCAGVRRAPADGSRCPHAVEMGHPA